MNIIIMLAKTIKNFLNIITNYIKKTQYNQINYILYTV